MDNSLKLNSSYEFEVIVEFDGVKFAGKLSLTPSRIILSIIGEEYGERKLPISGERKLEKIQCTDRNATFILFSLALTSGISRTITRHPEHIGFCEYIYEANHLIYIPVQSYIENSFSAIRIHSDDITRWIGRTELQSRIAKDYKENTRNSSLTEFSLFIEDVGFLGVNYNLKMYIKELSAGMAFPPSFFIEFSSDHGSSEIKNTFDKILCFLSVIFGKDLDIDMVQLFYNGIYHKDSFLYYPTNLSSRSNSRLNLFPLGHNLVVDQLNLPPFPINSFFSYYMLSNEQANLYKKYTRYKRLKNVEERFLGFFRLLESLCFKKKEYLNPDLLRQLSDRAQPYLIKKFGDRKSVKSFLKGLPRYNSSKYNTEKNIQDFLTTIPQDLVSSWVYKKKDIGSICRLRNDITHANDCTTSQYEISVMAKFIEVLLLLKLFSLIDIPLDISVKIIDRLDGYLFIKSSG